MNQSEIDRRVAAATGETRRLIEQRGFMLLTPQLPEPETRRRPLVVDWDQLQAQRQSA